MVARLQPSPPEPLGVTETFRSLAGKAAALAAGFFLRYDTLPLCAAVAVAAWAALVALHGRIFGAPLL